MNLYVQRAISIAGSQKKLADKVSVAQPTIWCWLHLKKKVSPKNVNAFIRAVDGEFKAYQIRPDLPDLFPHPDEAA
ncbi:YdaS family helix-turn-helix protein [Candidatus Fukatsuia symbiotica]|uniref:transcriptional regulator n=1 Tax=Candidatus Fukatsuia TaxID=1927833 RepID=UPI0013C2C898